MQDIELLENPAKAIESTSQFDRPGPTGDAYAGMLNQLRDDAPGFLLDCARRYGSLVPMMVGPLRVWLIAHPDAVDHVCRLNAKNYVKTRFAEKLKPLLGNGVATSNGSIWEASRSVIHPMLKPSEIAKMVAQMDAAICPAIAAWSKSEQVVDLGRESCALTLRVISRTMFGEGNVENVAKIVDAIDEVQAGLKDYIWSADPEHGPDPSITHPGFAAALEQVASAVREIIAKRRKNPTGGDMLSALIGAHHPETGEPYSDKQVLDEVMTIYMAGHETTGNTLSWLWETLARYPELQEKIREELLRSIPTDRSPTLEELRNLPITHAVLQETMRLKPSAFWFARTALSDDVIMGQQIKAGDSFFISQYVVQRMEEFWPNPDEFDHTRWLNGQKPTHQFAYMPFGAGVRTCPGGHFAMAEMCLAIARVLARYELRLPEQNTPARPYEALVTLRPKDGMPLRLVPLERTIFINGFSAGQHLLLDRCFRLRREVFVERLNWPLLVDTEGREIDQFDGKKTGYFAVLRDGDVVATARVLPAQAPTLLYDVFPHLITDSEAKTPQAGIWEGARLAVCPNYSASKRSSVCARLLADSIAAAMNKGISHIFTVSDPGMEKILIRAGAKPQRLGPVVVDEHGIPALALKITCDATTEASCRASEIRFAAFQTYTRMEAA